MKSVRKTRNAMLAAASALAASAAMHGAAAGDFDAAAFPAVIEAPMQHQAAPDAASEEKAPVSVKKWALIAAAAGSLAALVKLIGARRVAQAVSQGAVHAARATAKTATGAARAVGKAARSPLRLLVVLFGLSVFALTGVGLYDIEWIGGLVSGAALAGVSLHGYLKARAMFTPAKAKAARNVVTEN